MIPISGIAMGTRVAVYHNEIARVRMRSDDLCAAVSALLRHIARNNTAHAEDVAGAERWCAACQRLDDGVRHILERTQAELAAKDEEVVRTQSEMVSARRELERRDGRLKRYENSTTPVRHEHNEKCAKTRAEEQRMPAEENGTKIVGNHRIGPPEGHKGAECDMKPVETIYHEVGSRANAGAELILLSLIKDHVKKHPDHDWRRPYMAMAWRL